MPSVPACSLTSLIIMSAFASGRAKAYHIGTLGTRWGPSEVAQWRAERKPSRSYAEDVVAALAPLKGAFDVVQYGSLSYERGAIEHPLFAVKTKDWHPDKPSVLVTGGVHGYETSGVHGALLFLTAGHAVAYAAKGVNLLVVPCCSPWGYEHIQRWNPDAVDPNRSFKRDDPANCGSQEAANLVRLLQSCGVARWACHVDLHETTDTDETEFRPAKAARDGLPYEPDVIPDGFYLVSDTTNPQAEWHTAMIDAVRKVTHIAPPDAKGLIIGEAVVQEGVIAIPSPTSIGLCAGVTNAKFATTTEVYPDSPSADEEQCNRAQVATIVAALQHIAKVEKLDRDGATCAAA